MQTAEKLAAYLAWELALDAKKADALRFGAEVIFSTSLGIVAMALAGYLLGCLAETMAAAAACAVIRNFAGGAHCSTAWRCAFTSAVAFASLGKAGSVLPLYLAGFEPLVIVLMSVMSIYLIIRLAPVDSPIYPIEEPGRRAQLKKRGVYMALFITATLLVGLLYLPIPPGVVLAAAFGLGWSALIMTKPAHRLIALADETLGFCGKLLRKTLALRKPI